MPTQRERVELADGDFLDLDWAIAPQSANTGPRVLVLHGLEGSIRSHYAAGILRCLNAAGYRAALLHFRGCSGEPNRLPRSYHSGETGDLNTITHLLIEREPDSPLAVIGFSLGGNVLLKWLGEQGAQAPVQCAIAVSVPFQLALAAQRLERGGSRLYQAYLLHKLHRGLRAKRQRVTLPITPNWRQLNSFRRFDDAVTAPLHGFLGVDDYYARASSLPYLKRINRPTLILHAADDPFMTPAALPTHEQLAAPVRLELSPHGGHVGFVSGHTPWQPRFWLEERIPAFLATQLGI